MKTIELGKTGIKAAQLALGTGSLHHLGGPDRDALLQAALAAGITHFDTAPYYGFGLAERALAGIASNPNITIATKVGLYPPGGTEQSRLQILARKVAGKAIPSFSRPIADLKVSLARQSIAGSRQRLGRHRIDILFLHEPDFRLFASDEWLRFLESEGEGIGAFGVAGEAHQVLPFFDAASPVPQLMQTRDSLGRQEAAPVRARGIAPNITFGHLAAMGASGKSPADCIATAVRQYPGEVVLVSTRKPERIASLVAAAS